jgi:transcriptional regulator with XRE-family HTH domain
MLNLGALKLRRWRLQTLTTCPDTGRAKSLTQEEMGRRAGVSSMMISLLEKGERTPGFRLALRLNQMGVCAVEDWASKARCIACGIALGRDAPDCAAEDCEWRESEAAVATGERAAA